jgi:hypothetical protein
MANGVALGVLYVTGAAIAARLAGRYRSPGLALGLYFAGVGPGIALTSLVVPLVLGGGAGAWRPGWIVLGATAGRCAVGAARAARADDRPAAMPVGSVRPSMAAVASTLGGFALYGLGYSG